MPTVKTPAGQTCIPGEDQKASSLLFPYPDHSRITSISYMHFFTYWNFTELKSSEYFFHSLYLTNFKNIFHCKGTQKPTVEIHY